MFVPMLSMGVAILRLAQQKLVLTIWILGPSFFYFHIGQWDSNIFFLGVLTLYFVANICIVKTNDVYPVRLQSMMLEKKVVFHHVDMAQMDLTPNLM